MAKYTTEVRRICENLVGQYEDIQYSDVNDIIRQSLTMIFDFDYPIFDESYKDVLEEKIIRHYYTREIGLETYGLWKLKLETKLNEIMPYYNKLYESEVIKIDPLRTYKLDRNRTNSGGDVRNITENTTQSSTENTTTNNTTENSTTGNKTDNTTVTNTNENSRTGKDTKQFDTSKGETFQTEDSKKYSKELTTSNNSTLNGETNGTVDNTKIEALKDRYSDTPQGSIANLEDNSYLTNARINDNTITDNSTNVAKTNQTEIGTSTEKIDENTVEHDKHVTTSQENNNEVYDYSMTDRGNESSTNKGTSDYSVTDKGSNDTTRNSTGSENKEKNVKDSVSTTRAYVESIVGNSSGKSESKLLMEYRQSFLNIDMMVINELEVLFMQIW